MRTRAAALVLPSCSVLLLLRGASRSKLPTLTAGYALVNLTLPGIVDVALTADRYALVPATNVAGHMGGKRDYAELYAARRVANPPQQAAALCHAVSRTLDDRPPKPCLRRSSLAFEPALAWTGPRR